MSQMQSLATIAAGATAARAPISGFTPEQIDLVKRTIAKGASDDELRLFLAQCTRTGLDPFSRQIYWINRGNQGSTQVSIDGFRVIAERSGEMDGQETWWCGEDGDWKDVWLDSKNPPAACKVTIFRKGCSHAFPAVARWREYALDQSMWKKMPATMIAKCAEALALRKAFPHQLSGLYTPDEMQQDVPPEPTERPVATTVPTTAPAPLPPVPREDDTRPPLAAGAIRVERVVKHPTANPKVNRYEIVLSDGTLHETRNVSLAELADDLSESGEAIVPVFGASGHLTSFQRHPTERDPEEPNQ